MEQPDYLQRELEKLGKAIKIGIVGIIIGIKCYQKIVLSPELMKKCRLISMKSLKS